MGKKMSRKAEQANENVRKFAMKINERFAKFDIINGEDILSDEDIESYELEGDVDPSETSEVCLLTCNKLENLACFKFLTRCIHDAPAGTKQITVRNTYGPGDKRKYTPSEDQEERINRAEANHFVELIGDGLIKEMTFPIDIRELELSGLASRWSAHNPKVVYLK